MTDVLYVTSDPDALTAEVAALGGRIGLRLEHGLVAAWLPPDRDPALRAGEPVAEEDADSAGFDPPAADLVRAWYDMLRAESDAATRSGAPLRSWAELGLEGDESGTEAVTERPAEGDSAAPRGPRWATDMNGRVALKVVMVLGPGALTPPSSLRQKARSEVLRGLRRFQSLNPMGELTFVPSFVEVPITTPPKKCDDIIACEKVWRGPVMQRLGYTGRDPMGDFVAAVGNQAEADRAYLTFFSAYPSPVIAYCRPEEEASWVVMSYENGGYTPEKLAETFVHESMHAFHAQDEYMKRNTCSDRSGYFHAANCNSVACPGRKIPCLMSYDTSDGCCTYSRRQAGWDAVSPQTEITAHNEARSPCAPSLTSTEGIETPRLVAAFRGISDAALLYTCAKDGDRWATPQRVHPDGKDAASRWSPAIAADAGSLVLAYAGRSDQGNLYVTRGKPGYWGAETSLTEQVGARTGSAPALASLHGLHHLVYRGHGSDTRLFHTTSADAVTWRKPVLLKAPSQLMTGHRPALARHGDRLYLAYRMPGRVGNLRICSYDGTTWSDDQAVTWNDDPLTAEGPGLASLGDDLVLSWSGADDERRIGLCAVRDGRALPAVFLTEQNNGKAGAGVTLTPWQGGLQLAYRGRSSDHLWTAFYAPNAPARTKLDSLWQGC
ncbi:sialidase family protein [Streptomyces sp. NPDC049813]|uniref:sialidase family protein n=1 Tax=Streptomyces sp. NPDC049813 TaxID=3365597 RepID=UPI003795094D